MRARIPLILIIAVAGGLLICAVPHEGVLSLSELILQLSGSSGKVLTEFSLNVLVDFLMRMLPGYILELYLGMELYRQFCAASVYVFSRLQHRTQWYFRQVLSIAVAVLLWQVVLTTAAVLVYAVRWPVQIDGAGIAFCLIHVAIHFAWVYSMSMLLNLLAIRFGSTAAFITVVGAQMALTMLLMLIDVIPGVLTFNPIAHLILGWHSSSIPALRQYLTAPVPGLPLWSSLLISAVCGILVIAIGARMIERQELLISDLETG